MSQSGYISLKPSQNAQPGSKDKGHYLTRDRDGGLGPNHKLPLETIQILVY